jgi:hypothetical protein
VQAKGKYFVKVFRNISLKRFLQDMRGGGGTAPNPRLLVATVAAIAFKVNVLHHLHGDLFNFKLQGLEVLCGVSTSLILAMSTLG